jgi:hypothetical protein
VPVCERVLAVLGSFEFDVEEIDVSTLLLDGIPPDNE